MTTIASDGKSMAGDGQRNHFHTITNRNTVKVRRLADGSIIGTSGDVAFGERVVEWLQDGGDAPKLEMDGGFAALILKPTGELLIVGQDCQPVAVEVPYAVGSGMDLAIGAMAAGLDPESAVEIAARYDPDTGGTITTLRIDAIRAVA